MKILEKTVRESAVPDRRSSSKTSGRRSSSRDSDRRDARVLRSGAVLTLMAKALRHDSFEASAFNIVNELARTLECDRVSLGMRGLRSLQVRAISNAADIEQRQQLVRSITAAMQETIEMNSLVVYPVPGPGASVSAFMHAALARSNAGSAICSVPIVVRGAAVGVLMFERKTGFDTNFIDAAKDAACFVGPLLEMQYRAGRPLAGPVLHRLERWRRRSTRFPISRAEMVALAAAVLLFVAAVWPVTLRVSSPARVEGEGQRVIAAPVDGYIKSVLGRPGDRVVAGQLLVTLDDKDLTQNLEKWQVETSQLDREYRAALSKNDAAEIVVARARLAQAEVQQGIAERELARSRLVAPIDGVVVSGDLRDSLGMPVKRGEDLLTVAPDKAYRIVAEVDEQDIGLVTVGQPASVAFAALTDRVLPVTVSRISPVARTVDHRNVFEVDGLIADSDVSLYHGLTGVASIDIERRTMASVVWLRIRQRMQRLFWRLVG